MLRGSKVGAALLATSVLVVSCGGDETGASGSGGDGSGASSGNGAGAATSSGGGTGTGTGSGGSCSLAIVGTACAAGATCGWAEGCIEGSCECEGGSWACITSDTCQGMCPQASETSCGDPCSESAADCLCRCGGGPNFSSCDCSGGEWVCSACGG